MKIIIKENIEQIKKLYPITLTQFGYEINIGGYTLLSLIKEYFPEYEIVLINRDEINKSEINKKNNDKKINNKKSKDKIKQSEIIEIDSLTVPSIKNMELINEAIKKNLIDLNLQKINYPHEVIILNKQICKENLDFMKNKFSKLNDIKEYKNNQIDEIYVGKEVIISEYVVFDTTKGPIIIDDNSKIMPFCYLKGPIYIGKNCKINEHSSIKEEVIISNTCKIGGEIEHSVIMPYTNKQHYGYLGNSYLGSWVNLGAGTTTSDLKNTYGTIKVKDGNNKNIETNEQFLGSIICDYSKSAINTSIYTGKIIGVNSVIYGIIKENVGSFINYADKKQEFILEKAIQTQKRMFERRNIEQKEKDILILKNAFKQTKHERKDL